jgi:hypothetical protein
LALLTGYFFVSSCSERKPKRQINEETGVTGLERNDPTFLRLIDTAQKYMPEFIASFRDHTGDTIFIKIKDAEDWVI